MKSLFLLAFVFTITIAAGQNLYFPPLAGDTWTTLDPATIGYCQENIDDLYGFLNARGTKGFIALKDGKIVLEKYFGTFTQDSIWYWASAGKSLTAFLTGMAQEKGLFSIEDKTSKYLGEGWTSLLKEKEDKITLRHHLSMTTGLDDNVPDDNCMLPSCLKYKADAGTRWAYHNAPYRLIQNVIAKAWGNTYQNFMNTQLSPKTGIAGLWYDGVLYSKPRNMARFGLLMLNKGEWGNQKILSDQSFFNSMITPSQMLNKSYGLLWWLNGQTSFMLPDLQLMFNGPLIPEAPVDTWCALGKNDQKIYVIPSQNMVFIRMGNDGGDPVTGSSSSFDNLLWKKINQLNCSTPTTEENREIDVTISPNPFNDVISIRLSDNYIFSNVDVLRADGQWIERIPINRSSENCTLQGLLPGIYLLKFNTQKGRVVTKRVVKL